MADNLVPKFAFIFCSISLLAFWIPAFIKSGNWGKEAIEKQLFSFDLFNQIPLDWQRNPYTSITVTSETRCPDSHPEVVFARPWYGTNIGCDCIGILQSQTGYDLEGWGNQVRLSHYCTGNQTYAGCVFEAALHPVMMSQFNGLRICGRPAEVNFLNMQRPDLDGNCPEGYLACDPDQTPDNMVCLPVRSSVDQNEFIKRCPIVDMEILKKSEHPAWVFEQELYDNDLRRMLQDESTSPETEESLQDASTQENFNEPATPTEESSTDPQDDIIEENVNDPSTQD